MVELGNMENKFLYETVESKLIKDFLDEDTRKNFIKWVDSKWESLYYDKKNTDEKYRKHLEDQRIRQKSNNQSEYFSNNQFQVIKLESQAGKTFLNLSPEAFPKEFWEKAEKEAKKINPNCEFEYVSIVKYSAEFGEPTLRPHFDTPSNVVFILDYQLDGNTKWPISVKLEEFILENNECLVFDNNLAIHWRVPQKFKEGEILTMIFYSFTDENKEPPSLQGQPEEIDKYFKHYADKYDEVFGDSGTQSKVSFQTARLADLFRLAEERSKLKKQ